ncbi:MAG: single-stranded DNA-binding protein [Armatimonadetes bacterium]|nr:single-stranded DNA-binding protein [Armatimonadota bacterium]
MINVCVLVGRIVNDPEMRYTASGMAVVNFRLAVERQRKQEGQQDTDFLDIVAFGKTGEFVAQYLDKGARVGVEGRIQSRNWQTNDGQKRTSVEIVANTVQQLETRQESELRRSQRGGGPQSGGQSAPRPMPSRPAPDSAPAGYQDQGAEDYGPIGDDEDPFGDQ